MIYLDANAAAESPVNCGIARTTRRIYEALRRLVQVTPVVWSERHQAYCRLSVSERTFLEQPFARHVGAMTNPCVVAKRERSAMARWLRRWRALSLDELCRPGNTLLLPTLGDDVRLAWMKRAAASGRLRMLGVFHDAIGYVRHELMPDIHRDELGRLLGGLSLCQEVVTCSQESREALLHAWRELGCQAVPVAVEPWPTEFGPRGQPDPTRFDRSRVLYVSSLVPRKNHLTLLTACETLWKEGRQFELELIGREWPDGQTSAAVIEAIRRLEHEGRPVRWEGHVSEETLTTAYRECSFTVYPSLAEGFGLPIHESLWFSRPCICGTNGALGEVSAGGGCLPCDQTRVDSLAATMRQLLTDRALYVRLSQEAAARSFRSWDDYAGALRRYLRE
ncbi:MAG: glycosyltransferase [Verrucomicrobiia bacterium]